MPPVQGWTDPEKRLQSIKVPAELSAAKGVIEHLTNLIKTGYTVESDDDPKARLVVDLATTVVQMVEAWDKRAD
ncbi:hypothetical protein [Mycobacteroides abscessus]|uniref:hypothetical protein n=1 Tax=Mycobacteroides abscessus TaxID=36809 RepID=UPI0002585747|nr:hypothetical protein [Mycobacteroides abscessus]EIC65352.1 hypothetical protein S7W_18705 [Mycobacteroides abscessus M94]SKZ81124.1 Uncharacterised protein [Mycobacteroides abscessus subsp. abscessus]